MGHHPLQHFIIKIALLTLFLILTTVSAQGQAASAGLLCISECVTCPYICPPPPPPSQCKLHPPPPPSPSLPPPSPPKPPKRASSPPPPRNPPPPRFIYTFGGVPPPPKIYYGVFPAPPYGKGKPNDYENPYAYSSGVSCCTVLSQLIMVFVVLHMLLIGMVMQI